MTQDQQTPRDLRSTSAKEARARWLDASRHASTLAAELFQPGSGYGDPEARAQDLHCLETARAEAERLFREYHDIDSDMAPSHQGARHRFRLFAAGVDSFSDQQTRADSHYDNQPLTRGELNSPGSVPPQRRWSSDEKDALREMVEIGVSDEEIAAVLNRTVIAIFRQRYKLIVLRVRGRDA